MQAPPSAGPQQPGTGAPPPPFPPPPPPPPGYSYQPAPQQSAGMADNVASLLCYVLGFITGILFLVIEPYSKNRLIRFHAFQSIFVSVAWIPVSIAMFIIDSILAMIHLWFLAGLLHLVLGLGAFALWLYLMYSAYQGKKVVLPIIGPLAEKQAG